MRVAISCRNDRPECRDSAVVFRTIATFGSLYAFVDLATDIEGCVLRSWKARDRLSLVQHANNRKVWRNLTDIFPTPYTQADADDWIRLAAAPGRNIHLAIVLHGEAIGGVGINAREGNHRHVGRFGYWLGEAHWGRGIVTAAARALAHHALSSADFVRLEAPVFAWNPASARVLEKVGFALEGVHRLEVFKDGQFTDTLMYARVREPEGS